jgi:hypothetical protein
VRPETVDSNLCDGDKREPGPATAGSGREKVLWQTKGLADHHVLRPDIRASRPPVEVRPGNANSLSGLSRPEVFPGTGQGYADRSISRIEGHGAGEQRAEALSRAATIKQRNLRLGKPPPGTKRRSVPSTRYRAGIYR